MRVAADWIWTGEGEPFPGALGVEKGFITGCDRGAPTGDEEHSFPGGVMLPGLVNAHVHLDLTFPPDAEVLQLPFTEWLLSVRDRRSREGEHRLREAAARGANLSLASGTTLVVDFDAGGYSPVALQQSPIRRALLREIIGFRDDSLERIPTLRGFLEADRDPQRELRGLAPHAPYTVEKELLRSVVELAREQQVPWSMHIAEQIFEEEFLRYGTGEVTQTFAGIGVDMERFGFPGCGPIEYLERGGFLSDAPILVHANYLQPEEVSRIAAAEATVVYCPRSHRWFGHAPHPLPQLLEAGIEVALGTDSLLSNGELSILEEAREVRRAFASLSTVQILHMATVAGHRTLGNRLGSGRLEVGQPADFAIFAMEGCPSDDPLAALLSGKGRPWATFVAGELVHGNDLTAAGPRPE
ncbi:MAG: amidohydrolase family protein [Planctomycetota bacterium]